MTHRRYAVLVLAALALGGARVIASPAAAFAASPTLSVSPANTTAAPGDDIALDYNVANVPASPGLGGYTIGLAWDPAVLELTSFTDSGFITSGETIVICGTAEIDNGAGQADLFCTPVPLFGAPGVSTTEPRALAHSVFKAKAPGTTAIDITGSYLVNPSNAQIASTLANGSVTVISPPTATATAAAKTPTPSTPTASATPPAATATQPPAASATTIAPTSTKPAGETLSRVEAPRTGSGTAGDGDGRTGWWIAGLTTAGAIVLATGGVTAYRRRRTRGVDND